MQLIVRLIIVLIDVTRALSDSSEVSAVPAFQRDATNFSVMDGERERLESVESFDDALCSAIWITTTARAPSRRPGGRGRDFSSWNIALIEIAIA